MFGKLKKIRWIWLVLLSVGTAIIWFNRPAQVPRTVRQFAEQYRSIREYPDDQSMERLLSLFCWNSTSRQHREAVIRNLYFEMDIPILSISFRAWTPDPDTQDFFPEHMHPNLEPQWVMIVIFAQRPKHTVSLPLGYDGQDWKIVNPAQKEV